MAIRVKSEKNKSQVVDLFLRAEDSNVLLVGEVDGINEQVLITISPDGHIALHGVWGVVGRELGIVSGCTLKQ